MNRNNSLLVSFGIVLALLLFASCKDISLNSEWRTSALASDNPDTSWQHTSTYAWEDQNILLGLQNDAERLVILIRARDRATQATMIRSGLTIWFDPTGKKDRSFGIHYPMGRQMREARPDTSKMREARPDTSKMTREQPIDFTNQLFRMPDTMEIINGNEHKIIPIQNDLGFSILSVNDLGTITLQYSIPLKAANSIYGVNVKPGSSITLGFETGDLQRPPDNRDMGRPPGEGQGPDGGFGGRGGGYDRWGGPRDSIQQRPRGGFGFEPVQFWTKVILASAEGGNK